MKDSLLVSDEWCDIVFEGRNQRYGAYVLRRDAGRRYRYVAMILGAVLAVVLAVGAVAGFMFYRAIMNTIDDIEHVVKLKPLKDDELKTVSVGRRAVANASPDAVSDTPEVVDEAVASNTVIGVKGPDDGEFTEANTFEDQDHFHNAADEALPIEGAQLTKVEMVEEMPMFPGGLQALMRFMDEHCIYSQRAIKSKMEGDVEVAFIIDTEGNVIEPEIIKSLNSTLDAAVMTAVRQMPKWRPGTYAGRPTCVKISIPVHFQIK